MPDSFDSFFSSCWQLPPLPPVTLSLPFESDLVMILPEILGDKGVRLQPVLGLANHARALRVAGEERLVSLVALNPGCGCGFGYGYGHGWGQVR